MNTEQRLSFPGVLALLLFFGGVALIVWSFFRRALSTPEKVEIVKQREEPLGSLEQALEKFKDGTNRLAKAEHLGTLETYGLSGKHASELYAKSLFSYNKPYVALCEGEEGRDLRLLKSDIEMLISRLGDKELRKTIHSLYRRERVAHAFDIFRYLYKTHYSPDTRIERRIDQSSSVPLFEQAFRRAYKRIEELRKGVDLD